MIRMMAKHTSNDQIVYSIILPPFFLPSSAYSVAKNLGYQCFISANIFLKPISRKLLLVRHYKVQNLTPLLDF